MRAPMLRTVYLFLGYALLLTSLGASAAGNPIETIAQVKKSVVAIGTFDPTRQPQFAFRGTGFVVGDGTLIATNAHVLPAAIAGDEKEKLVIALPGPGTLATLRDVARVGFDADHDLALLRIKGMPMTPVTLKDGHDVREGESLFFTGFPIGTVLGLFPATHNGMVSALTPIAIAPATASQLDPKLVRRLSKGSFQVFQLDGTAYPGNSGSPLYEPDSGEVVGIINMVFVKGTKEAALTAPSGITYAIPATYLQELVRSVQ